jgi:hypothetical protein
MVRNAGVSDEAKAIFLSVTTGSIPGGHNGTGHKVYSDAVGELLQDFMKEKGIDPAKMTAAQAREFVNVVAASTNPKIADFNRKIMQKILTDRMQKLAMKRLFKWVPGSTLVFVATAETMEEACFEALDGVLWGIGDVH